MYRQIIKAKDIQKLFGKKTRASFSILSKLRVELKKEKHHQISISDFCTYYNIDRHETAEIIHRYDCEEQEELLKAQNSKEPEKTKVKSDNACYEFSK